MPKKHNLAPVAERVPVLAANRSLLAVVSTKFEI